MGPIYRSRRCLLATLLVTCGCVGGAASTPRFERTGTVRAALTTCISLAPTGDALLSNPPMDKNFGVLPILRVGGKDESLVQFDLGSVPPSAAIDSAALQLYVSGSASTSPVNAHRVTSSWAEGSVTFASFSQHYDVAILGELMTTSVNVQKSIDLTAQVTRWITGAQPNYGVLLESSSANKTIFVSHEGGQPSQKPALSICYTTPDDHCTPNPCQNGATCANGESTFTCDCLPGYTAATCATPIDDCASNPCLNGGTCTSGVNTYTCSCASGYTGTNCETLIDNCASGPCQNGGVCQNGVATYHCQCPPGYTGANCETLIDNCASDPCQNGGTCTNEVNSYTCACATGFAGTNCEINIDDCASQPCFNGGTCIDGVNAFTCSCPPDWGGTTCSVNLNTCSQNPCLNRATCANGYGKYTCTCAAGFTGSNCEIDINDCSPNPCQNGGVCVDGVNSYTCTCPAGFTGASCEVSAGACNSDGDCAGDTWCSGNICVACSVGPSPCGAGQRCNAQCGSGRSCLAGVCASTQPVPCGTNCPGGDIANCIGECHAGTMTLVSGVMTCVGSTGPVDETCNGLDDDCDGQVDERTPVPGMVCTNGGAHPCRGVVDPMVRVGSVFVYQYEASRPDATALSSGLNGTRACSKPGTLPWTSVTWDQAATACAAVQASDGSPMRLCSRDEWEGTCNSGITTGNVWSYLANPTTYQPSTCNGFDLGSFKAWATGSGTSCAANLPGGRVYDLSGNVAEWTSTSSPGVGEGFYEIHGGAFRDNAISISCNAPASVQADGYAADNVGFRCCSDALP